MCNKKQSYLGVGVALLMLLPLAPVFGEELPAFEDYPAEVRFTGSPKIPSVKTRGYSSFRERVRETAKQGPNFAGKYAIAQWRCGNYCVSIAVVDVKKGTIFPGPFSILERFGGKYYGDVADNDAPQVEFQLDSRLLVARGCPEIRNCATHYYEWTGVKFVPLHHIPATIPDPH